MTELLVVLAVLAVIASIALPAASNLRLTARSLNCLANLRQMGVALQMYRNDNHQTFPQPFVEIDLGTAGENGLWFNAIDRYAGLPVKKYTSASHRNYSHFKQDPVWAGFHEDTANAGGSGSRTIKMNLAFGAIGSGVKWVRTGQISHPDDTVVLFDSLAPDMGFAVADSTRFHGSESHVVLRHGRFRTANVLFVDGHASEILQIARPHVLYNILFQTWYDEPSPHQKLRWAVPN